ncbi:YjbD family protein [Acidocella sp. MX-AZ03]|nr:DUF2813 domain-containing protein [Acidocella sp. MX-AZ03]WBO58978.1 YjbD family protein [Acidocella sp. MX-AZ03]
MTIEALPTKIFDILSRTQISLSSKSGARIPITRHGNGAQSLAVICLFDAFLQSRLESSYGEHAEPLLALEEPEAHLHPSAAKAVGTMLQTLSGQKIITTHSGDLLAGVPLTKIRRLSRRNGEIRVHQIGEGVFTKEELRKLDYQVRLSREAYYFPAAGCLSKARQKALCCRNALESWAATWTPREFRASSFLRSGLRKLLNWLINSELHGLWWLIMIKLA